MGTLYLISTPIGNLQDITLRAIRKLFEVDVIACEDTRRTGTLLETLRAPYNALRGRRNNTTHHKPKLLSYFEHNELRRNPEILSLLHKGHDVALISDAGTPMISDPGFKLIRECIKGNIPVVATPGPTAVIAALTLSGLPTDKFLFAGYPPKKSGHRIKFFENIKKSQESVISTIILFEAPHKLLKTLEEIKVIFGDIRIVLCRELTKIYEEVRREKISESIEHFQKTNPKGEFVILFHKDSP